MLLGSVSNYLIQKSSVPVMVARKRLRRVVKIHKPKSELNREARVNGLSEAAVEKVSNIGTVGGMSGELHEKVDTTGGGEKGKAESQKSI
jgi:hypothetical protein